MNLLETETPLHDLARAGTKDQWTELMSLFGKEQESLFAIKFHLNRRDELRYTPLHAAIFARNLVGFEALLHLGADVNLKCFGAPSIHLVLGCTALPDGSEFGTKALTALLDLVDLTARDDQNASVLHIAAELDLIDALKQLLETEDGKELLDAKDRVGFRALHRAAASNAVGTLQVLIKSGASLSLQTPNGSTALHVAAASGAVEAWALLVAAGADASGTPDKWGRSAMAVAECHGWRAQGSTTSSVLVKVQNEATTQQSSSARQKKVGPYGSLTTTAILSHPLCTKHFTCPPSDTEGSSAPPENVKRITVLLDKDKGALRSSELAKDILWEPEARAAALADVLRVHEWNYIRQIQSKCEGIARDAETSDGIDNLDGDTTLSRESFAAALHAAGSVCQAVDLVAKGDQVKNAFCAVRPPGHHAGPRGLVKGEQGGPDSHGFCFLNNISIGAAYALHVHREKVKRVVIVDFDVHHGNGTEETVRWLVPGVDTHETITATGFGTSYTPRFKPWHDAWDARNVLFVSVHGYGPREEGLEHLMPAAAFYPGSGRTVLPEAIPPPSEGISASDKTDGIISAEIFEKPAAMKKAAAAMRVGKHPAIVSSVDNENDHDDDDDEDDDDEGMGGQPMEQVQAGGDIDDEDDDDDDDEDYQNDGNADDDEEQQEDDDDDDDDEPSMPQARQPTNKVQALLQMFIPKKVTTSSSAPSSSSSSSSSMPPVSASPSPAAALLTRMDPLILDIGVRLPGESLGPEATAATSNEYRHQWRNYFRDEIFPRMMTFQPDMIFISAGFDAHKKDTINGGYIALLEEDFEWVTTNLLKIANTCCEGRVVSALEGGYQLGGEYCSSFAKSVKTHVAAMVRGGKCLESKYNQDDADKEKAIERELLDDAERRRVAKLEQQLLQQQLQQQQHDLSIASSTDVSPFKAQPQSQVLQGEEAIAAFSAIVAMEQAMAEAKCTESEEAGGAASSRKRRRAQVDYVALNEELKKGGDPA